MLTVWYDLSCGIVCFDNFLKWIISSQSSSSPPHRTKQSGGLARRLRNFSISYCLFRFPRNLSFKMRIDDDVDVSVNQKKKKKIPFRKEIFRNLRFRIKKFQRFHYLDQSHRLIVSEWCLWWWWKKTILNLFYVREPDFWKSPRN